MTDLELRWRKRIIDLIVAYLLNRSRAGMLTTDTVQRTPYGQLTRKKDGTLIFTAKQANLVPTIGGQTFVLETGGDTWALGDSKRYRPPSFVPSRGGGVPVPPLPHQPAAPHFVADFYSLSAQLAGAPQPLITWAGTYQPRGDGTGGGGV